MRVILTRNFSSLLESMRGLRQADRASLDALSVWGRYISDFIRCVRLEKDSSLQMTTSGDFCIYPRHAPVSMQFRHKHIPCCTCENGSSFLCKLSQRTFYILVKTTALSSVLHSFKALNETVYQRRRPWYYVSFCSQNLYLALRNMVC